MTQIKQFNELEVGQWYIPIFENLDPKGDEFYEKYYINESYYKYLGDRDFENEYGELAEMFFDPDLQMNVAVDAADGYIL